MAPADANPQGLARPSQSGGRVLLLQLFSLAKDAASPDHALPPHLPELVADETVHLISVGKAGASMARAAFDHYGRSLPGVVLTRYGHLCEGLADKPGLRLVEAGHPLPDAAGYEAAANCLQLAEKLGERDHLLVLLSGGASALLACPAGRITTSDLQQVTRELLLSGATIAEINCVRKHLSLTAGGRLAEAAAPARVTTRLISDVAGDDIAVIGSGPTVPDPTSRIEARAILDRHCIAAPASIVDWLANPESETPKPGESVFASGDWKVVARARDALDAVAGQLCAEGFEVVRLGDGLEGEAADVARNHAALARAYAAAGRRTALISGGELTVTLGSSRGRGGPNTEYVLALAVALDGQPGIAALACDTDGIDGSEDNAGAVIDSTTLERARRLRIDCRDHLARHDSYAVFEPLGDLVRTGPTLTNVNDLRIILIDPETEGRH